MRLEFFFPRKRLNLHNGALKRMWKKRRVDSNESAPFSNYRRYFYSADERGDSIDDEAHSLWDTGHLKNLLCSSCVYR